uniref:Fas apoptotic inhibitory molecule 1 n=1 Tax=Steinernema glaseri TaxID=37863 RepID=A0A1I7Z3A7_9BILA
MFKLVGREIFELEGMRCLITVEALGIFAYEYSLEVNGKTFQKFREQQNKRLMTWYADVEGKECRVCLEKETMDVWVNGIQMETTGEFTDEGTVTHFTSGNTHCCFKAVNSGKRNIGIVHELYVNGRKVDQTKPQS